MNVFSRSWQITKITFHVIKEDKELLLYPLLAGFFSFLLIVVMMFPVIIALLAGHIGLDPFSLLEFSAFFILYFGTSFIATFFNVCVVYTAKKRFEGGNAKFGETITYAFSKTHRIFAWSVLSATIGILLRLLENFSRRSGFVGKIVLMVIRAVVGISWSIVTIFVVPSMVYNDLGPIGAIRKSVDVFRKTWGESVIRFLGLGFAQFLFLVFGVSIALVIFLLARSILLPFVFFLPYLIFLFILFSVANTVFNTALFAYATSGKVPSQFEKADIKHSFK